MHKSLETICSSLDALSTGILNGWSDDRNFNEVWGWNCPAITRQDLATVVATLANNIRRSNAENIEAELLIQINKIPKKISALQTSTLPQLYGGNNLYSCNSILGSLQSFEKILNPLIEPQELKDIKKEKNDAEASLRSILKTLRALEARTTEVASRSENLNSKIELIEQAHDAAEQLPTDLAELKEKRDAVEKLLKESTLDKNQISLKLTEINLINDSLGKVDLESKAILERCEATYRATTSEGLASAFADRAKKLNYSMWIWVIGLVASLYFGSVVGSNQLRSLALAMNLQSSVGNAQIWIDLILAILSVGAPVWFGWLSTKQIGQRFRLAEDYGYKASISKAYEGYRREAALLDPNFQARLFSSALTRLDEVPLRLVETDTHGSPWHELLASKGVKKAIDVVPDFIEKVKELAKNELSNKAISKIDFPESNTSKIRDNTE